LKSHHSPPAKVAKEQLIRQILPVDAHLHTLLFYTDSHFLAWE
jgi:hypothetical protein